MKETRFNLIHDWQGIGNWYGLDEEQKREMISQVVEEVDKYRYMPMWKIIVDRYRNK